MSVTCVTSAVFVGFRVSVLSMWMYPSACTEWCVVVPSAHLKSSVNLFMSSPSIVFGSADPPRKFIPCAARRHGSRTRRRIDDSGRRTGTSQDRPRVRNRTGNGDTFPPGAPSEILYPFSGEHRHEQTILNMPLFLDFSSEKL